MLTTTDVKDVIEGNDGKTEEQNAPPTNEMRNKHQVIAKTERHIGHHCLKSFFI